MDVPWNYIKKKGIKNSNALQNLCNWKNIVEKNKFYGICDDNMTK